MEITLKSLSDNEVQLCHDTILLNGTLESKTQQLTENGTFDKYRSIQKQYFDLLNSTSDEMIKIESLKRLTFLSWYSILEPNFLTGIDGLNNNIIFDSFKILNEYIAGNKLDVEFTWMLSFYSSWDYIILSFSENKLDALTSFVKNVDSSILHIPKKQLTDVSMVGRGQMGIYYQSYTEG